MENIMTYDTLRHFAYSNDRICQKPIRGVVLSFFGLGGQDMYNGDTADGLFFAAKGILYLVPYNNPWAWMNKQAVSYTDELVDLLINHYHLSPNIPIVSTGGSMGGQSALTYMVYARHTPIACIANCPVCDLPFHYTERDDLPRTLYSAFYYEKGSVSEVLQSASPIHLIEKMPEADYIIFHCEKDLAVNKENHSDLFVAGMREQGHRVIYHTVPERGHCDLPENMWALYNDYAVNAVLARR